MGGKGIQNQTNKQQVEKDNLIIRKETRRTRLIHKFIGFVLIDCRKLMPAGTKYVHPAPESPEGLVVPEVVFTHGGKGPSKFKFFLLLPYMIKTIRYARKSSKSILKNPHNPKKRADESFFKDLESYAKKIGCTAIGYTKVPNECIFKDKPILYKNAIVLLMDMKRKRIQKAPSLVTGKEVWQTYAGLTKAVYKLSEFMRKRGFNAQPDPPIGGRTNFVLLAQKAGLGYIGKHGLLISERNGPAQRIAAVYTDIENLPFTDAKAKEYEWIADFCDVCQRCVRLCPAQAIYKQPLKISETHLQSIDFKKCAKVFAKTVGCAICIKECVFFRSNYNRIKQAYEKKATKQRKKIETVTQ